MVDMGDNGNGRITLALVVQKLDTVIEKMDELSGCYKDHALRLALVERCQSVDNERIKNIQGSVDILNKRDGWGTVGTSIAVIIAGMIAWFKQ